MSDEGSRRGESNLWEAADQKENGEESLSPPSSPPSMACLHTPGLSETTSSSLEEPPAALNCIAAWSRPIQPDNEANCKGIAKKDFIILSGPLDDPFNKVNDIHTPPAPRAAPNLTTRINAPLQPSTKTAVLKPRRPRNYKPFPISRLPRESVHCGPHPRGRKIHTKSKMWMVHNAGDPDSWYIKKQLTTWIRNIWEGV